MRNPSDHFLRCINSDFDRVKATIRGSFRIREHDSFDPLDKVTTAQVISVLLQAYQTSEYAMQAAARFHEFSQHEGAVLESSGTQASFWKQMTTLTRRSFTNMSRDVGYYWLRVVMYVLVSICVSTIYLNVGTSYEAILARGSCASFIFGFVTFMSIGGFPSFVEDMKVFLRERLNGHYGVFAFVMGNTLSSMPFLLLISVLSATICYFLVGLHPGFVHYLFFTLTLYTSLLVVEGLMMVIASLVPNFLMGIITGAGIQGIFMLVAGYFRLLNDLPKPVWRYPMSYLSFDYWALQGQFKNDLIGMEFDNQVFAVPPKITGKHILEHFYQISTHMNKWVDLAMIVVMVIMYRLLFLGAIKVKESVVPQVRAKLTQRSLQMATSVPEPSPLPVPSSPIKLLRRM
ncbi:hypothetical protein L7F22_002128 [Adiantum nelumboides]|nr:hypothetical protein [Adiantum nelumboides]